MDIRVLGPVMLRDESGGVVELSPQLRRLLAVLVVAAPGPVSAGRLAELVADGRAEGSTVRTAISRLRKSVGERLVADSGGYRLELGDVDLDLARFDAHRSAAHGGDTVHHLEAALACFEGRPFGELASEDWALPEVARLDKARRRVAEELGDAYLAASSPGRAAEVVEPLLEEDPYAERPVELMMRALAANGETTEALRVYERFRVGLRDDIGIDPSSELQAIEAELLAPAVVSRRALPDGTVTFLFTDIEGSTERWQADEASMVHVLASHDQCLREAVEAAGGIVFKHTGDGICAVFVSAVDGVRAAEAAQLGLDLPVRMGLHSGLADRRGDDYFGSSLNRAARVMDAGHGGQILVSSATAALLERTDLVDLGDHELKGLAGSERIFQVGAEEFPPLRTRAALTGNLPPDPTPFVGRTEQLDKVALALAEHRLVTLLGVGGTGKTRLSLEVARRLGSTYPDGCWLVELAPVTAGADVALTIANALGIPLPQDGKVLEHVIRRIRHQRLLIVLDNCEHLLGDAAEVAEAIIDGCPAVTVLATSREPLVAYGERLLPLPPLPAEDAVTLFEERARVEAADLVIDTAVREVVEELCERLDRLPLAIELAASQLRMMSPVELLESIEQRFRLLVAGRRSRMERHRTMRSTLDWSYDRCDPDEQRIFDRLAVFPATFDLGGVEAITADLVGVDRRDTLRRLIDRSLVQRVEGRNGRSAYRLLETMRAYGQEHLDVAGEARSIGDAHTSWVLGELGRLGLELYGPNELTVEAAITALLPDALAACERLAADGDLEAANGLAIIGFASAQPAWDAVLERLRPAIARRPQVDVPLVLLGGDMRLQARRGEDHAALVDRALAESLEWTENAEVFTPPPQLSLINGTLDLSTLAALSAALPEVTTCGSAGAQAYLGVWNGIDSLVRGEVLDLLVADIRAIAEHLDSATLRRRAAAVEGFSAESDRRWDDALRAFQRALDGVQNVRYWEVSAGFGVIRTRALAGHDLDPAEFHEAWGRLREQRIMIQTWNGLLSSAVALDRADRTEHALRILAFVAADAPQLLNDFLPSIRERGLLTFSLDDLPEPTGSSEEHIDEILAAVDQLAADRPGS